MFRRHGLMVSASGFVLAATVGVFAQGGRGFSRPEPLDSPPRPLAA